ncbi:arginine--tRNA ligase [Marinilactibacillus psychrotolerans]|uniref:Arginine--tRNA ligase n=1 Tax=Marinilactibacillus psychrotolerans TaxID=191770 RepID=A0A5R9C7W7_9LACT|nr:arginine--tRNA ligase [Marinilactibacillus psychrotolerans]TLQ09314.1 arginine--tRNA ligase [Marinilactibacillus psychrotolerans]GEQ32561.1 arginyl-tRNA synthetase [Marinilactibacillus psychrotolerans]
MEYKQLVAKALHEVLKDQLELNEISHLLEKPKMAEHGDLAFPTFQLAKVLRKSPAQIAANLESKVSSPIIEKAETVGPYLNFFLKKDQVSRQILNKILEEKDDYGSSDIGEGQNVPIDMSSPNIAKPMSMGHLRSTVIGNALSNILRKMGYNPIRINYLGDWGTQFGKLISAYKKWGNEEEVRANPIKELLRLYVTFHEEAEKHPELEDDGRAWFKKLEDGNEEALDLWNWFRKESLEEFQKVYDRLNIDFDSYNGEAFYNDKMDSVVSLLDAKDLLKLNQGAHIVDLEKYNLNPALIKKTDGATLYITRDLAAALYRKNTYKFSQALYVVGQEQANHFKQLKAVLSEMGYDWAENIHHIPFGLITKDGKKLSTRKGKVVLLEEVLNEASKLALNQIETKNPNLEDKEIVAEQVGVGAVIFHDLKNDRLNNFDFTIEEVVQFEGETGPYVQYTRARALSILKKAGKSHFSPTENYSLTDDYSWEVLKLIQEFPETLQRAYKLYEPSIVAKHAIHLAQAFNKFYANIRVLDEHPEKESRLALVFAVTELLKQDLTILGVEAPDQM